jgi:cytochrome b6-f complex iron-sulfur subunit
MNHLNRREFVAAATVAACACAIALPQITEAAPEDLVDVGTPADYPKDGVIDKFVSTQKFFVIRKDNKIFATSALCTHKNCVLKPKGDALACRCHGSTFNDVGEVTKGPAKVSLPRFGISINDQKHLIVDKSTRFEQANWNASGASVSVS